ncbi:MAG TPA: GNAT family N-acetyltransferase [Anaerolineae bacterium]|nr:GNAT family N-acetyltransferase [Anaerolineae bacterium]
MDQTISLRSIVSEDRDFLYRVYASTRADELKLVDWDDTQKRAFLEMQFNAQHTYYTQAFAQAEYQIILLGGEPIGRLYVDRRPDEIRLIDIALLPEYRGQGIGSYFLEQLFGEARRARLPVRIHVEQFNPALRLYLRLGFRKIGDTGVYFLMEWSPPPEGNGHG